MSVRRTVAVSALLLGCSLALAADEEVPDPDFLEYLGMWEESDEDWILLAAEAEEPVAQNDEETEAAEQVAEAETDDES